jgi:Enoyl-(Acyl carrier protein) reductase
MTSPGKSPWSPELAPEWAKRQHGRLQKLEPRPFSSTSTKRLFAPSPTNWPVLGMTCWRWSAMSVTKLKWRQPLPMSCLFTAGSMQPFNNAGIIMPALKTADTDNAIFDRVVAVNLAGVWNSLKHELIQMRKQRSGAIVNNSSIAGLKGSSVRSAYTATKHAVLALTKSAALEEGGQGIRVNAVCPGTIITPMVERMIAAGELDGDASAAASAIPRLGRADEIAEAVLWLCSPGASYVTGVALPVDGGLAAG